MFEAMLVGLIFCTIAVSYATYYLVGGSRKIVKVSREVEELLNGGFIRGLGCILELLANIVVVVKLGRKQLLGVDAPLPSILILDGCRPVTTSGVRVSQKRHQTRSYTPKKTSSPYSHSFPVFNFLLLRHFLNFRSSHHSY